MKNLAKLLILCTFIISSSYVSAQQETIQPNVQVQKVTAQIYMLTAQLSERNSVNLAAFIGEDGLLLVDAGYNGTAGVVQAELKKLDVRDASYLINTHLHGDHIGGNALLGQAATIIAHKNTRLRLTGGRYLLQELPERALPSLIIENELSIYFNGEEIKIIHLPAGHTDGDIVVFFTKSKVVCMGDLLFSDKFPFVDYNNGGGFIAYYKNIEKVIEMFPEDTKYIAGHGRTYSTDDLKNYVTMMKQTSEIVGKELNQGKTTDDIKKANVLKHWDSWGTSFITADFWIDTIERGLSGQVFSSKKSIIEPLFHTLTEKDAPAAIAQYHELKKNQPDEYDFGENNLNAIGYYLLRKDRINDAIEIFKLNVELYPESWNVYDSLGEAYMKNGDKELAIKNYEKSLQLNPNNNNGVEALKKLK